MSDVCSGDGVEWSLVALVCSGAVCPLCYGAFFEQGEFSLSGLDSTLCEASSLGPWVTCPLQEVASSQCLWTWLYSSCVSSASLRCSLHCYNLLRANFFKC